MDLPREHTDRALRVLAAVLAAACLVGTAAGIVAEIVVGAAPRPPALDWAAWASSAPGAVLALSGAVLVARLPRHPMAWLLLLGGAVTCLNGVAAAYAVLSLVEHAGTLPLTVATVQAGTRLGPLLNLVPPLLLLFFPDGRLPSPRWRWPAAVSLTATAFAALVLVTVPLRLLGVEDAGFPPQPFPLPLPDATWAAALAVTPWLIATSPVIPVIVFAQRFRGADRARRTQLRWMLLAALLNLVLMAVPAVTPGLAADLAFVVSTVALAVAVLVAVGRYRLYDVDLLLGRTLVYGGLAAAVVAVDLALFVGVSALVDEPVAAVVAAGVVAVLYAPLRNRIQVMVNRLLTGRAEPYDLVSELADRLERTSDPEELLLEVARTVSASFRSPYVRVELDRVDGTTVVAEHGLPRASEVVLPFAYRGAPIGRLVLVPAAATRPSPADQRLLADVVRQAAAAVRATALTEELQRSREDLVTRVADERRRLRRDLHDGLGPALAAAALKVQAAQNLTRRDVDAARGALDQVRDDLSTVLSDVRRLVHDLRPPALDQLGLAGAIRHQAAGFVGPAAVTVQTSGDLSTLPAAVEVAAYRIACEALANASRHAAASRVGLALTAFPDRLEIEIVDDGRGVGPGASVGVGLVAMRERAEELGGRCTVTSHGGRGARVHALLPFGHPVRAAEPAAPHVDGVLIEGPP
ncbi:MAG: histidine kinase [Pseudonocardia sp.]|nr:histidine kinase [Pseudonocardia sp.]